MLRHNDRLIMVDALGSSEAIGMATNTTRAGEGAGTARFSLGANTRVVTEDGRDVEPGSGERGHVALRGFTPVGYYKDPEKSAATFRVIDGVRYSIPGDWAEVDADGTVQAARPWQPVHQHRRREGVPGGGRGGAQAAPVGSRRGGRRRARRALRRGDHRARRAQPGRDRRRGRADRPRQGQARRVQGTQARAVRRARSPGPPTASSTTSSCSPKRVERLGLT